MKYIFSLLVLISVLTKTNAQSTTVSEDLNDYEYIIVPIRYEFQKSNNQYRINSKLRYELKEMGFKAFMSTEELPSIILTNTCNRLDAAIVLKEGFIRNKMRIQLFNCNKELVYQTPEVDTKNKDYDTLYMELLNKSLFYLKERGYRFSGRTYETIATSSVKQDTPVTVARPVIIDNTPVVGLEDESEAMGTNVAPEDRIVAPTYTNGVKTFTFKKAPMGGLWTENEYTVAWLLKTSREGVYLYDGDQKGVLIEMDDKSLVLEYAIDGYKVVREIFTRSN